MNPIVHEEWERHSKWFGDKELCFRRFPETFDTILFDVLASWQTLFPRASTFPSAEQTLDELRRLRLLKALYLRKNFLVDTFERKWSFLFLSSSYLFIDFDFKTVFSFRGICYLFKREFRDVSITFNERKEKKN